MAAADVIPSDTAVYPPKPTPQLLRESYPSYLNLKLVLFVHRHGERTPIRSCTHLEFLSGFDLSLTVMPTVVSPVWNLCHMNSAFVFILIIPSASGLNTRVACELWALARANCGRATCYRTTTT